ncbi:MAG TPA: hypothetical protein VGR19_09315 [Allosphingosinicella sp.]|nr:hypothetical protein [Allosphingosinicella sp.]
MTTFRSEDTLVGIVAAVVVVPWVVWTISRGLRDGKLPIGRAYVRKDERAAPFWVLMGLYVAAAGMAVFISLDLLFGPTFRKWL